MLLLESTGKERFLLPEHQSYPREMTSSTASRSTFFWLSPLFLIGYKRNITLDDLDLLDPAMRSEPLSDSLMEAWGKGKPVVVHVCRPKGRHSLSLKESQ